MKRIEPIFRTGDHIIFKPVKAKKARPMLMVMDVNEPAQIYMLNYIGVGGGPIQRRILHFSRQGSYRLGYGCRIVNLKLK